jgi:hypothetical protein
MAWNPLLWWQWNRLRLAIELDCDLRVLRRLMEGGPGGPPPLFGVDLGPSGTSRGDAIGRLAFGWVALRTGSVWPIAITHWLVGVSCDWFILR